MTCTAKLAATMATLILATAAFAGCSNAPTDQAPEASSSPAVVKASPAFDTSPAPAATELDACADAAQIDIGGGSAELTGELADLGVREFAEGEVGLDDEGDVVTYTVAPGDVEAVIGERLCLENGGLLGMLNHVRTIQPGQVLRLVPDPEVFWVPYYNPDDAPAGFQQIPYQQAIEAMGAAADAGDVDAMRAIWADELSSMFTSQTDIGSISRALEVGDPNVLRQMFS